MACPTAERGHMEIVKLTRQNLADVNKSNQPFEVIGKIKPAFSDGIWTYTEELYDQTVLKAYPNDGIDYAAYIDDNDKAVFLAYSDEACIGQIVLKKDWNEYAFIEDICVARSARGQGVGTALIQKAAEWAKNADLKGLALETQDIMFWRAASIRNAGLRSGLSIRCCIGISATKRSRSFGICGFKSAEHYFVWGTSCEKQKQYNHFNNNNRDPLDRRV